jgi:hypothetical protein
VRDGFGAANGPIAHGVGSYKNHAPASVGAHPVRDGFGAANGSIAHGVGSYKGLGAPCVTSASQLPCRTAQRRGGKECPPP